MVICWNSVALFSFYGNCIFLDDGTLQLDCLCLAKAMCLCTMAVPGVLILVDVCFIAYKAESLHPELASKSLAYVSTFNCGLFLLHFRVGFSMSAGFQKSTRLRLETREWDCLWRPSPICGSWGFSNLILGFWIWVKFLVNFRQALLSNFSDLLKFEFYLSLILTGWIEIFLKSLDLIWIFWGDLLTASEFLGLKVS